MRRIRGHRWEQAKHFQSTRYAPINPKGAPCKGLSMSACWLNRASALRVDASTVITGLGGIPVTRTIARAARYRKYRFQSTVMAVMVTMCSTRSAARGEVVSKVRQLFQKGKSNLQARGLPDQFAIPRPCLLCPATLEHLTLDPFSFVAGNEALFLGPLQPDGRNN